MSKRPGPGTGAVRRSLPHDRTVVRRMTFVRESLPQILARVHPRNRPGHRLAHAASPCHRCSPFPHRASRPAPNPSPGRHLARLQSSPLANWASGQRTNLHPQPRHPPGAAIARAPCDPMHGMPGGSGARCKALTGRHLRPPFPAWASRSTHLPPYPCTPGVDFGNSRECQVFRRNWPCPGFPSPNSPGPPWREHASSPARIFHHRQSRDLQ